MLPRPSVSHAAISPSSVCCLWQYGQRNLAFNIFSEDLTISFHQQAVHLNHDGLRLQYQQAFQSGPVIRYVA